MTKKKVDERINNLRNLMFASDVDTSKLTYQGYHQKRKEINELLISILIGAEIKDKKNGEKKLVMKYPLPTRKQLSTITVMLNTFIDTVENEILLQFMSPQENPDDEETDENDDFDIPERAGNEKNDYDYELKNSGYNVLQREKISKKEMRNIIFGYEGEAPITNFYLNSADVIQIASMGETLHKRIIRNRCLIIGGISVLLVATGTAAVCAINHNKKKNNDDMDDDTDMNDTTEEPAIEYDDPDLPELIEGTDTNIIDMDGDNMI